MYSFDDSRRPLYITRVSGRLTDGDIESMERDVVAMLETRSSYGNAWDLTALEFPTRPAISRALKMSQRTSSLAHELYESSASAPPVYAAFAMGPRITKLVQFFHRMSRSNTSPNVFASFEEALAATEQALAGLGVQLPRR